MEVLNGHNLIKTYSNIKGGACVKALDNFNIRIEKGEFLGVMGPSGSGKTTLLNILATIDTPSSGEVHINGTNPMQLSQKELALFRRRELGFVFQDFNLLDTLTIKDNILLPLVLDKIPVKEMERRISEVAALLHIDDIMDRRPYEVSGGQQQRAACARALIHDPSVILADEPTGNLDSRASGDIMQSLKSLNEGKGATILMVTHDAFAASFCSRIVMIKDGRFFLELKKGKDRQGFFQEILNSLALLGGGKYNGLA